jgi:hypothetical protein
MFLFPNFLDDMESYRACESFWRDVFQNVLLVSDDALPDWRDEEGNVLTVGGVQFDPVAAAKKFGGNSPILWKISPSSARAIRLTHTGPAEHSVPYLEAKMDAHAWMDYDKLNILRIYTIPSENEVTLIKMIMSAWVRRSTSLDDMYALTDRLYREGKTSR